MSDEAKRNRLPFEPANKRPKTAKKPAAAAETAEQKPKTERPSKEEMAIPAVVSQRMGLRMAVFCGIPTALGMSVFVASYFIVTRGWFKLPHIAVVMVSMAFFGLGVLGLTYGVLSASWDEEKPGSALGWQEFTTNWGRITQAWRSAREKTQP